MTPRLLFSCLCLSACTSVVPTTAARLAATDPLTADPGEIELAVILPPGLAIAPGSAVLEFGATRGAENRVGRFTLQDTAIPARLSVPKGASARAYALTDRDADDMRALQNEIAQWKREGEAKGHLSLGISGCALGPGPAPDAVGSVLIRMAEDGPFLPLIQSGRLADLLGPGALAAIQPCKGAE